MSDFILSCCTPADLPAQQFENRNIEYLCFHYYMDDVEYVDDLGKTITNKEFYKMMVDGAITKTSQPNVAEYLNYFTKYLEQGKDILHLCLSSGLSGSYNSARSAAGIASERFPGRKVYVVDSLCASSGIGLFMDDLADMRDAGKSIDEMYEWAVENRHKMNHWFFSTDLTFYVRGGRISKAAGLFGGMLNICPVLNMDEEGRLSPRAKVRSKRRAINDVADRMVKHARDGVDYNGKCYISHSDCIEDSDTIF